MGSRLTLTMPNRIQKFLDQIVDERQQFVHDVLDSRTVPPLRQDRIHLDGAEDQMEGH